MIKVSGTNKGIEDWCPGGLVMKCPNKLSRQEAPIGNLVMPHGRASRSHSWSLVTALPDLRCCRLCRLWPNGCC
jgi:hypothetical protein